MEFRRVLVRSDGVRTERFKGFVQKLFALFGSSKEDMEAKGKTIIRYTALYTI